jgi:hypothetical protein
MSGALRAASIPRIPALDRASTVVLPAEGLAQHERLDERTDWLSTNGLDERTDWVRANGFAVRKDALGATW